MITWQTQGAFLAFVGWSLWTARHHLRTVARHALGRGAPSEGDGALSNRVSVWGLVGGCVFIVAWLHSAGMQVAVAVVLLAALLVSYFGAAKMVAEIGLPYTPATFQAEGFVVATVGTANMTPNGVTALAFAQNMQCYGKGMVLPTLTHVVRLGDYIRSSGRHSRLPTRCL